MENTPPITKKPFKITTVENTSKWADLPKDILFRIVGNLDLTTDLPRVRGVCPTWRSCLPRTEFPLREIHIQVPRLGHGLGNVHSYGYKDPLFLVKTRFYLFYPLPDSSNNIGGWIARMGEVGLNKWRLLNPFYDNNSMKCRRYLHSNPPIVGEVNLLDCRVVELARPMSLVHKLSYDAQPMSKKVVSGDRAVLVQLEERSGGHLMLWRFGDEEWVEIRGFREEIANQQGLDYWQRNVVKVHDIAFHKGRFYVTFVTPDYGCRIWVINPGNLSIVKQQISGTDMLQPNGLYLRQFGVKFVSSQLNGCLYLLVEMRVLLGNQDYFNKLFLLNEESGWESVDNMGGQSFFVGRNVSFGLPVLPKSLALWKPNSICSASPSLCFTRTTIEDCVPKVLEEGFDCLEYIIFPIYKININKLFTADGKENKDDKMMRNEEHKEVSKMALPPAWVKWRCPSVHNAQVMFNAIREYVTCSKAFI